MFRSILSVLLVSAVNCGLVVVTVINWTYQLCFRVFENSKFVDAALIVASLNMLFQIFFSVLFGTKGLPKIRGYRGE